MSSRHDHQLKIDSTTDNFELMRDENGQAMYRVETIIKQHRDPLTFTQVSWLGGHGQHDMESDDMYFEGQSIDTTQEGRVFLGPKIYTVQEDDDTALDTAPVKFLWNPTVGELIVATGGKIYRYIQDDTGLDTDEALDATETAVTMDADATAAIPVGSIVEWDSEFCEVTATGVTLTVIRGVLGTTAATHDTNKDTFIRKWTPATTTVAGVTDLAIYKGVVFAGIGASTAYKYSTDDITWTTSTLTDKFANYFLVSPDLTGLTEVLWKAKTPNEVARAQTGINDATGDDDWRTPNFVGDTTANITKLFLLNNQLMVGRVDGLWHLDSDGNTHQQRPDLLANRSTDNFKYVTEWQAGIYHSEIDGMGEIWSYNNYEPMGPLFRTGDISKRGDIVGEAADKDWLYVAVDEGTNTIIYKGREVRKDGDLRWEWCPWVFAGTNAVSTMTVVQHTTSDRRLWFGYGTQTAYVILSDNPTDDSAARFASSGFVRMSYDLGSDLINDKQWQSAVLQVAGGATGETVQVKYRKDTDTSASSIIAAAATNGTYESNFSSALTSKRIQYELHLASNTVTATPEVSYFQAKGVEKPTVVRIHEAVYRMGDKPTDRVSTLRSLLRTAGSTTNLIRFADLRYGDSTVDGATYVWTSMAPGWPKEVEILRDKSRQPEIGIQVKLIEISYTLT